jgi:short-subunit dehydrogenase
MVQAGSSGLITGASGRIGEQFARRLADTKIKLVVMARSQLPL